MATVILGLCITQELGGDLQSQGLLEEKDWEGVKDSLNKPAAVTPDSVQLKHLQHQVRAVPCWCSFSKSPSLPGFVQEPTLWS